MERPLLERLQQAGFLMREGSGQDQYRVSLAGLLAIDSDDSRVVLSRCSDIFANLQAHFHSSSTRGSPKSLSKIRDELQLTDQAMHHAVVYSLDSGGWMGGRSNSITPLEQATITPNEGILDFESFGDVLDKVIEFRHPAKYYRPNFQPLLEAVPHARALELMQQIAEGERAFEPSSDSPEAAASFQTVARDLDFLYQQGCLQFFQPQRLNQFGRNEFKSVKVGGLTFTGETILKTQKPARAALPEHKPARYIEGVNATVFISHIKEEAIIALALKKWIEDSFVDKVQVFVSSDKVDIPSGSKWLDKIDGALERANLLLILCSEKSLTRPWINFEAGCGWIKRVPIVPVCHSGIEKGRLPSPVSMFQGLDLLATDFAKDLLGAVAQHMGIRKVPPIDHAQFQSEIHAAARAAASTTASAASSPPTQREPNVDLSNDALTLLLAAASDSSGSILSVRHMSGHDVQAGGQNFGGRHGRESARWTAALEELLTCNLITPLGNKGELFELTNDGWALADKLARQR